MIFDLEGLKLVMELFLKQLDVDERILTELAEKDVEGCLKRNYGKRGTYSLQSRRPNEDSELDSQSNNKVQTEYLGFAYEPQVKAVVEARFAKKGLARINNNIETIHHFLKAIQSLEVEEIADELPITCQRALDLESLGRHLNERVLEIAAEDIVAKKHNTWPHKTVSNVSADGKKVRSKLEALICLMLDVLKLPYDYDTMERLEDEEGRMVSRSPDFKLWTASRRRGFIEAVGKIDDDEYFEDFLDKVRIYHHNGIDLGDNLVVICDHTNNTTNCYAAMKFIQALAAS
ncbi:MAG: hypothetical protein IJM69_06960 [Firmicutes bacterium]|nr:hypothetical protein [Bacillota bacterium]